MGLLTLTGSLQEQPNTLNDGAFPSGVSSLPFTLNTGASPKCANASTGIQHTTVSSPNSYVTLAGVGPTSTVVQGDTLYLRTTSPMLVRLTFKTSGADLVSVVPVQGLLMIESSADQYVKLIEVQGSGVVEWFASGK